MFAAGNWRGNIPNPQLFTLTKYMFCFSEFKNKNHTAQLNNANCSIKGKNYS